MSRARKIIFAISGAMVLLASLDSPVLLPYPLFVAAYLRSWRLPTRGRPVVQFLISTLLCTLFLESSAWLNEFVKNEPQPALFHPQLIPDLLIGFGLYLGWWLAWALVLKRYRFATVEVFIITGLYGVLIEQQGKVFLAGLQTLPFGILSWLFVFVVYGSTMALAFWLVRDGFNATRHHWVKYPLAWSGLFAFSILTSLVWGILLQVVQFAPSKLPIREHPLW